MVNTAEAFGVPTLEQLRDWDPTKNPTTTGQVPEYNATTGLWGAGALTTGVSSVSNSDGTLTISPTTGAVVASLNLAKANTWIATETFQPSTSTTAIALLGNQTTASTAMVNVVYTSADQNGLAAGTYPLIQVTYGTDLYIGVQAGNVNNGSSFNSNVGIGYQSLYSNTTGAYNNAVGVQAMYDNTTGSNNSACGCFALYHNTTGIQNTALGYQAATGNTTGQANVAVGWNSLLTNSTGSYNTACGYLALYSNTASYNTAVGEAALYSNTTGNYNAAVGLQSMNDNTTGVQCTAMGASALLKNTSGSYNTAVGYQAAASNTTSENNIALGVGALISNTTSNVNIAIGNGALYHYNNTAGNSGNHIALGYQAAYNYTSSETNNIVIGINYGVAGESNMIRIGSANSGVTGQGQVAFSQIGLVGLGLAPIYGSAQGVAIGTSSTVISSFTPTATGTFRVTVVVEAKAAATLDSLTVTYTSSVTGATLTQTLASTVAFTANTGSSFTVLCYATTAAAVSVQATASLASDLYGTATIERLA